MPEQFTQAEFITSIREKYPQYNDIDDSTLVNSIVDKFPVYKDQISDFGQEEVIPEQTVAQRALDITPEQEIITPTEQIIQPPKEVLERTAPEQKGVFKNFLNKSFVEPFNSFMAGVQGASGNILQTLNNYAKFLEDKTGIPRGGLFEDMAKLYRKNAEKHKAKGIKAGEGFISDFSKALYEGSGQFALDLPIIASLGQWGLPIFSAISGGGKAVEEKESVLKGLAKGGIEGVALHTVLKATRFLPRGAGEAAGGAIFGGLTLQNELQKPEGEVDWSNIVAQTLLGIGLTMQGKRIPQREFIDNIKTEFNKGKPSFLAWAKSKDIPKENAERLHSELEAKITEKPPEITEKPKEAAIPLKVEEPAKIGEVAPEKLISKPIVEPIIIPDKKLVESNISKLKDTETETAKQITLLEKADTPNIKQISRLKESQKRVKEVLEEDNKITQGNEGFTEESVKNVYEGAIKTERFKFEDLDADLKAEGKRLGITNENFVEKFQQFSKNPTKLGQDNINFFKEAWQSTKRGWTDEGGFSKAIQEKVERKEIRRKLIDRAKILEEENNLTEKKARNWKKSLFGVSSLKKMNEQDIARYNNFLTKKDPASILGAKSKFGESLVDVPRPDNRVEDVNAYVFKDRTLQLEATKNFITKKGDISKESKHALFSISGMARFMDGIQRKYEVPIFDSWSKLIDARKDMRFMYEENTRDVRKNLDKLTKEDRENITDWLEGKSVELNKPALNTAKAIRKYYDDPTIQLLTKLNRFAGWYEKPSVVELKGVDKADLLKMKEAFEEGGLDPLIKVLNEIPGMLRKDYVPEISSDLTVNQNFTGIGKGLLKDRTGKIVDAKKDAVSIFYRKVGSDLKITYLDKPTREMLNLINKSELPENIKKKAVASIDGVIGYKNYDKIAEVLSKIMGLRVRSALLSPFKWTRNFLQRGLIIAHTHPKDIPNISWKLLEKSLGIKRMGPIPISPKVKLKLRGDINFNKAPQDKKDYFLSRVAQNQAFEAEYMMRGNTPILNKLGKFGQTIKRAEEIYLDMDTMNRWTDFNIISTHVEKMFAQAPFSKIRNRIFWHGLKEGTKKQLLPEIDAKNFQYVSYRIAEEITGEKAQWRYDRTEKSPYEQETTGHLFFRVTTFPRSYTHALIDATKTMASGAKNGDWGQFFAGARATIGYISLAMTFEKILEQVKGEKPFWGHGYNPASLVVWEPGGLLKSALETMGEIYGNVSGTSTAITNYMAGDISEQEFKKSINKYTSFLTTDIEKLTYGHVLGYRNLMWVVEAISGKEDVKPMKVALQKMLNKLGATDKEIHSSKDVDRDALELFQKAFFGAKTEKREIDFSKFN